MWRRVWRHPLSLAPRCRHPICAACASPPLTPRSSTRDVLPGHSDRVTCIAISRDGTTLASGQITHMGYLAEIIIWDITDVTSPSLVNRLRLHKVMVQALDFSMSGKYLASIGGPDDNNLVIWNVSIACPPSFLPPRAAPCRPAPSATRAHASPHNHAAPRACGGCNGRWPRARRSAARPRRMTWPSPSSG